jgi:hypothetical protein
MATSKTRLSSQGSLRAAVNREILATAPRLGDVPQETVYDFLCECGADGCRRFVAMTLAEYEARSAQGRIVARGHA